jgi:hypothetical protein
MLTPRSAQQPRTARIVSAALAPNVSAHERQRELVRASLLAGGRSPRRASAPRRSS